MKYIIGFILGMLTTALFFMWWMRRELPSTTTSDPVEKEQKLPEGFNSFYQKFHQDSIYQMSHITFPLEGLPAQADSNTIMSEDFRWRAEDWIIHKNFDSNLGEFRKELSVLADGMIVEQITHQNGQFGMQRRYAKLGDEWYLIYYSAMNRIAAQN